MGEVVLRVVLGVRGAVAASLLVLGAPRHEAEQARAAGRDAAEDFDEQQRDLVVLAAEGVVVITCVELYEAAARGMVVRAIGDAIAVQDSFWGV